MRRRNGRLAGAARSDERDQLSRFRLEADMREGERRVDRRLRPGSERGCRHSGKETSSKDSRPATSSRRSVTASGRRKLDRQIEIFEDAIEEREGALDLDLNVEELTEREEEPALQRGEGDDIADA